MTTQLIKSYIAYDLVKASPCDIMISHDDGSATMVSAIPLKYNDYIQLGVKCCSGYILSSAASYALSQGKCPIKAYNRCLSRGESPYNIISLGSILTDTKTPHFSIVVLEATDLIYFEGKLFFVVPSPNNNLSLVEVSPMNLTDKYWRGGAFSPIPL